MSFNDLVTAFTGASFASAILLLIIYYLIKKGK